MTAEPINASALHAQPVTSAIGRAGRTAVRKIAAAVGMTPSRLAIRTAQVALDSIALAGCFFLAYALRFDFAYPPEVLDRIFLQVLFVVALQVAALRVSGAYAFVWRYVGLSELRTFAIAAATSTAVMVALRFLPLTNGLASLKVPLTVTVLDGLLAFGGVVVLRVIRRVVSEHTDRAARPQSNTGDTRVLLIGAGQAGVMAAREIALRGDTRLDIRGFVDDDPQKKDSVINGIRVLGTTADLPRLVRELDIDHVVITMAQVPGAEIRRIVELCERIPVKARTIPGLYELLQGNVEISRIRNIEIEDLLGRETVELDLDAMASFLTGKTVMVTGAGGSIGSELVRQVARFGPARLLLVERAEFALFEIEREIVGRHADLHVDPLVADTGDVVRMREIFSRYQPQVVVHAAAHKHVPMMELQPSEAVKNNILTTRLLGHIAGEFNAESFVLVSTDKAVNPTSVMGASKRVAELVIQDLSQAGYTTRFVAVRFGNVMGSAGSVIPIFRKQIEAGGPVTVTHPNMTRYFMTIPEASQLVLQAGAIGGGGEIFVLDMGEPVKIVDLALQMIKLSGLKPYEDIDIAFTGIRPGEKLFEELDRHGETISRTMHPKIFNGNLEPYAQNQLAGFLERLEAAARNGRHLEVRRILSEMLPESRLEMPEGPEDTRETAFGLSDQRPPLLHARRASIKLLHPALDAPKATGSQVLIPKPKAVPQPPKSTSRTALLSQTAEPGRPHKA
jgi:FlaA1/EpsC-like NDP-sugar epimerase